jgi:hypothetical protein
MFRSAEYWQDRADEARAIASCMEHEEMKRMMSEIAADYDRLAKDAKTLETQQERAEKEAKRFRQKQAAALLVAAPFSNAQAEQAIDALMDAPFSRSTRQ